ncbi:hypothetical protein RCL1_005581 [Eukaryota sp. TZLM3-RCL]
MSTSGLTTHLTRLCRTYRNRSDALVGALHASLLETGCTIAGTFKETSEVHDDASTWSDNDICYSFLYRHPELNELLVVRIISFTPFDNQIMFGSTLKNQDYAIVSRNFRFRDFLTSSIHLNDCPALYHNLDTLLEFAKSTINYWKRMSSSQPVLDYQPPQTFPPGRDHMVGAAYPAGSSGL